MGYAKSCFKGNITSYCANKTERHARLVRLTTELGEIETEHKTKLNLKIGLRLKEIRKEINNFYTQEMQKKGIYIKQKRLVHNMQNC